MFLNSDTRTSHVREKNRGLRKLTDSDFTQLDLMCDKIPHSVMDMTPHLASMSEHKFALDVQEISRVTIFVCVVLAEQKSLYYFFFFF